MHTEINIRRSHWYVNSSENTFVSKFWSKDIHWEQKSQQLVISNFKGRISAFIVVFKFVQPGE